MKTISISTNKNTVVPLECYGILLSILEYQALYFNPLQLKFEV